MSVLSVRHRREDPCLAIPAEIAVLAADLAAVSGNAAMVVAGAVAPWPAAAYYVECGRSTVPVAEGCGGAAVDGGGHHHANRGGPGRCWTTPWNPNASPPHSDPSVELAARIGASGTHRPHHCHADGCPKQSMPADTAQSDGVISAPSSSVAQPADDDREPAPLDPRLADAVELAREAAGQEAGPESVGEHVEVQPESGAVTHLFESAQPAYRGWRWAVTVATADQDSPVTVSEVVLLPGPDALTGAEWIPWSDRIKAGDLGVGDLVSTRADDPRLVPGYLQSDDPAVEQAAHDLGLGRVRVLSRYGRDDAARRWQSGEFGPRSDMARGAPATCGTCGFYLPLAGSLRAAFGACGNEIAPADGQVVHVEYGCGAHSEAEVDLAPPVAVTGLVYDDTGLDLERNDPAPEQAAALAESSVTEPPAESAEPVVTGQSVPDSTDAAADSGPKTATESSGE